MIRDEIYKLQSVVSSSRQNSITVACDAFKGQSVMWITALNMEIILDLAKLGLNTIELQEQQESLRSRVSL